MQEPPFGDTVGQDVVSGELRPGDPLPSLWSVTRRVLSSPRHFFDTLQPNVPAGAALVYFLICYLIAAP